MSGSPNSSRKSSITSNSTRSSTSRGSSGTSNNTQSSDISSFSSESRPSSSASRSSDASLYKMFKEAADQNPIPKKPTARPVSVATTRVKTAAQTISKKPSPYIASNTRQMKAIMNRAPQTRQRLQVTFNKTQDPVQKIIRESQDLVLGRKSPYRQPVPRMRNGKL